ncbi:MAG: transport system ATPase [Steroidobacteraceae bacterium]|nr:transport system ATPase [Steroidobacteraceae bacterium]
MTATGPADLLERVLRGDRAAIARTITLIDRRPLDAPGLDAVLAPHTGRAATVGVTGAPGAGKSTLVGSMLKSAVRRNDRVAVLALDPVSPLTRGAVLGDRLRMEHTTSDERVFVRSMTADNGAGGLSLAAPFAIRALDAAGWPWIVIETVGVGQTEFDIVEAATTTVVVMNPGAGDEVQAVKAGLLEMADVFVLNKADRDGARTMRLDLERTVQHAAPGAWRPPIVETVASEDRGTDEVWAAIAAHRSWLTDTGAMPRRQQRLLRLALQGVLSAQLDARIASTMRSAEFAALLEDVQSGRTDLALAGASLLRGVLAP